MNRKCKGEVKVTISTSAGKITAGRSWGLGHRPARLGIMSLAVLIAVSLILSACGLGPNSPLDPDRLKPKEIPKEIKKESDRLNEDQAQLKKDFNKPAKEKIELAPVMPVYDPLKEKIVSFTIVDEDMRSVLFVLAQAVGMNIIIDPKIMPESSNITLHFERVPASKVLKHILGSFDLYYQVDGNVIVVQPFQEKIFRLNFLDANMTSAFDIGGDVLGAGEEDTVSGLTGSFRLTGEGAKNGNPYDMIDNMVKPLVSGQGKYSLNRLAGTLYVKDSPSSIAAIEKIINHYKEMLGRQIMIEAQIIEVTLSDEHRYGIDWSVLQNNIGGTDALTSASWSLGAGLVLNGTSGDYSLLSTINALNMFGDTKVISNPTIRVKHAQPAIMSVGTSISYKKSVKTTLSGTSDNQRESTEVDVSTVFDGLILGVIPFIERSGKISLLINPIKSEVDQASLEQESVSANGDQTISLPQIQIKEINTTISLNDGDAVILGGLIDRRTVVENRGIPGLSSIPILGYLFKNKLESEETRELVLVLSVNIV